MKILTFDKLAEEQVNQIADFNFNYWKKFNPALDEVQSKGNMKGMKKNVGVLPIGLALVDGNDIVGFCTLRLNRLDKYLHLNPWICNVMIFEKYQGKGCGKILIDKACEEIKKFGYVKVYSWTDQAPEFYKKLGFKYEHEIEKNEGGKGLLFSKEL